MKYTMNARYPDWDSVFTKLGVSWGKFISKIIYIPDSEWIQIKKTLYKCLPP
jgi:hypothetical protein